MTKIPKSGELCWYNDIRVHPYALEIAYQWLKHILYVQYVCGKQSEVDISLNHDVIVHHFHSTSDPKFNIGGNLGLCIGIRVHSYALETAYQYLKHLVND